jgi:hypothetical protein
MWACGRERYVKAPAGKGAFLTRTRGPFELQPDTALRELRGERSADDVAHVQGAIDAACAAMEGDDSDVDVTSNTSDVSAAAL